MFMAVLTPVMPMFMACSWHVHGTHQSSSFMSSTAVWLSPFLYSMGQSTPPPCMFMAVLIPQMSMFMAHSWHSPVLLLHKLHGRLALSLLILQGAAHHPPNPPWGPCMFMTIMRVIMYMVRSWHVHDTFMVLTSPPPSRAPQPSGCRPSYTPGPPPNACSWLP
jgi:hypothetical protein